MSNPLKIASINKKSIQEIDEIKQLSAILGEKWRKKQDKKINDWLEQKIKSKS